MRPGNLFEPFFRPTSARTATPKIFVFALCVMLRADGLTVGGLLISRSLTIHDAAEPAELRRSAQQSGRAGTFGLTRTTFATNGVWFSAAAENPSAMR